MLESDVQTAADITLLAPLEDNCKLLGSLLDDCVRLESGDDVIHLVERIRTLSDSASHMSACGIEDASSWLFEKLSAEIQALDLETALPLIRAFTHYLNLTSFAEQHHLQRMTASDAISAKSCDATFEKLLNQGLSPEELFKHVCTQHVEIVLTAHPTQVNRRTLQYKFTRIATFLERYERSETSTYDKEQVLDELAREILSLWQTDELRRRKPTPLDEARGGLHIIEQSLWGALPAYLRRMSATLKKHTGKTLPLSAAPITFASWMGGDRDGNPNVTSKVTMDVSALSRWMAADMYIKEVDALRFELSMTRANQQLIAAARELDGDADDVAAAAAGGADQGTPTKGSAAPSNEPVDLDRVTDSLATPLGPVRRVSLTRAVSARKDALRSQLSHSFKADRGEVPEGFLVVAGSMPAALNSNLNEAQADWSEAPVGQVNWGPPPQSPVPTREASQLLRVVSEDASEPKAPKGALSGGGGLRKVDFEGGGAASGAAGNGGGQSTPKNSAMRKVMSRGDMADEKFQNGASHAYARTGASGATPYRSVLSMVRHRLASTKKHMEDMLSGRPLSTPDGYETEQEFLEPLLLIHQSLYDTGAGMVADGRLTDLIRRVHAFGLSLMKLDIRQEAERHTEALDTVTQYLELGSYASWPEAKRLEWITAELQGRRPLVPPAMPVPPTVREVLETFRTVAALGSQSLGAYVISMTQCASDVLAVELLQREARLLVASELDMPLRGPPLRVVPLFETLKDLTDGPGVMRSLLSNAWYRDHLKRNHGDHQEVMLGYSDSGKDAGRLAAAWALYTCQERLVAVCKEFGVRLTLFHGRGGSIGRGGGPMHVAINSQPPGSVAGSLRITEQGEMVQAKFGLPGVARHNMEMLTTAVLLATVSPAQTRKPGWTEVMNLMGEVSCDAYRGLVVHNPDFMSFFQEATPEEELGNLNIGSRPTRRKQGKRDIASMRAIPWIFAWTQCRSVLPAWLGVGRALQRAIELGHLHDLQEMYRDWPFFRSLLDLVQMVLFKVDMRIAQAYADNLCTSPGSRKIHDVLKLQHEETMAAIVEVTQRETIGTDNPQLGRLIAARTPYINVLNVFQVEVLKRLRSDPMNQGLRDALLISINGIAAGMRNTG